MKKLLVILIGVSCLLSLGNESYGQFWKKKKKIQKTDTVKKETKYDKLFKKKKVETEKGFITLHKMDEKVYFEFPLDLLEKDMLLASTVSEISDNDNALVGQKPHYPLHVKFKKLDSTIYLSRVLNNTILKDSDNIRKAVEKNNIDVFIKGFKIKAYNNDSTAVVFDATSFFVSDYKTIDPFDPYSRNTYYGFVSRIKSYKSNRSCLKEIKAFSNNISIKSYLSYTVDLNFMGMAYIQKDKPFTAVVNRCLSLLPEKIMRPRLADVRINYFNTPKINFSSEENKTKIVRFAHRWRLEPKNVDAYKRGELVEPKKPITYYVDDAIPETWKKYVKAGILDWNKAFERIGFKNAVVAKDFPKNDADFDPENLNYSCIRYVPTLVKNSMGPSWVDPRSGEIINASVYLYHNIISLIHDWRMLQTAAADPRVRRKNFGEKLLGESIRYVVAHEVGHTLGLMHNMSASAAIPTEKLRDPEFTKKYGTTYSIMDYARNNYVAQPGDYEKGVRLTPPNMGVFDYYSIKWGYTPIYSAKTPEDEVETLDRWITEKAGNPIYRYGKQQIYSHYDPSCQTEDLGNDAIKSSTYGIKNLKYILPKLNDWVKYDDKDYSYLKNLYYNLIWQYNTYLNHVTNNIGGIYINEAYRKDPLLARKAVPRKKQKESVNFILSQIKQMDWIENTDILKHIPLAESLSKNLKERTFEYLMYKMEDVIMSSHISEDPYKPEEFFNDIYKNVFGNTIKGKSLQRYEMDIQTTFIGYLINFGQADKKSFAKVNSLQEDQLPSINNMYSDKNELPEFINQAHKEYYGVNFDEVFSDCNTPEEVSSWNWQTKVRLKTLDNYQHLYYDYLVKALKLLKSHSNSGNSETRMHNQYLIFKIKQVIK